MLLAECNPNDYVALSMYNPAYPEIHPIEIPFRRASQFNPEFAFDTIERICISKGYLFLLEGTLIFTFHRVQIPNGQGRSNRNIAPRSTYCKKWQSFVQIKNNDSLCLARAIVTGIARHLHVAGKDDVQLEREYKAIRQGRPLQGYKAQDLIKLANVPEDMYGDLSSLNLYQAVLPEYQILVFKSLPAPHLIFKGDNDGVPIYLHFEDSHYDVIAKPAGAFGFKFFCEHCFVPYNNKPFHKCVAMCKGCQTTGNQCEGEKTKCNQCRRHFTGPECFARHVTTRLCNDLFLCPQCYKLIDSRKRKKDHLCGEVYCLVCADYFPSGHLCFMKPAKPLDTKSTKRARKAPEFLFVFFDLETIQVNPLPDGKCLGHQVILCVSQTVCPDCIGVERCDYTCGSCGTRERVFAGVDPVNDFIDYLTTLNECQHIYPISHNGKAFDMQFLLKHILEKRQWAPEIIMQGSKILTMSYKNVKFLDSISFIPFGLAKFNDAFGLNDLVKGYFPHMLCNTTGHVIIPGQLGETNFVLTDGMPPVAAYAPERFFPAEHDKFMKWYQQRVDSGDGFNFTEELIAYCKNDVYILRQGCLQFHQQFLDVGGVAPFRENITLASSVNLLFRRQFLKPNTIPIIPSGGYRAADIQSLSGIQWLEYEAHKRGIKIQHAKNGRERKVLNMKVDGLHEKTVFEFWGCYYHGCPQCFKNQNRALIVSPGETAETRFASTMAKRARILEAGYEMVEMWEHDFLRLKNQDPELKKFLASRTWEDTPLEPRDAFFGGRTNAIQLYHKVQPGEKIHYLDVCSLYPWVNKYARYPIGHPKIILENFPALDAIFGLVKCTVLPPTDLYHPLLPYRSDGKLLFPLCRECADTRNQEPCTHDAVDRAITGTWVSCELQKAVQLGYVILKIYEVWHYNSTQYDPATATGGLFASYIDTFLKVKQEASGWPDWVKTENDKEKYIHDYKVREGVTLDPALIEKNPGRRVLAKLCLNSFWGKLGQRSDQQKCDIINEPDKFFSLMTDPNVEVKSVVAVNEGVMVVKWQNYRDIDIALPNTSVIHAIFTTAHARLKLYSYLEELGRRICYFDTDSIIFATKPGESNPETGDFLGDLTSELSCYGPDAFISEFASGGPKNYGYVVECQGQQHVTMKCKGFRLDQATGSVVNFAALKKLLGVECDDPPREISVFNPSKIIRFKDHTVATRSESRRYQIVYDKRRRLPEYQTLPFGFK